MTKCDYYGCTTKQTRKLLDTVNARGIDGSAYTRQTVGPAIQVDEVDAVNALERFGGGRDAEELGLC